MAIDLFPIRMKADNRSIVSELMFTNMIKRLIIIHESFVAFKT